MGARSQNDTGIESEKQHTEHTETMSAALICCMRARSEYVRSEYNTALVVHSPVHGSAAGYCVKWLLSRRCLVRGSSMWATNSRNHPNKLAVLCHLSGTKAFSCKKGLRGMQGRKDV